MIVGRDVDPLTVNEAGPEHKCIQYKLFHGGVHKRTEKNAFLKQFMDGHWSTLDKTMLRFVGGSALVIRIGGPSVDRAIRGVVATIAALRHDCFCRMRPPKSLRLIWQKADELKSWAKRGSFDATPEAAIFPSWEPELLQAIYNFYRDVDCNVNKVQECSACPSKKQSRGRRDYDE
ncbi:hypothetical protein B5M09_005707 [Aphanomyces astaci]|uniref:Uncharacterized protein n=1 Tax=Aphanomyces astaci TaxID=112090 RepID=A0A3R7Y956_APHAT|nr:hypothetical protein B5M09_005707 [Aphanomyces astaci]